MIVCNSAAEHVEQHYTFGGRTTCHPSESALKRLHSDNDNADKGSWCFPERSFGAVFFKLAVAVLAGMMFGWSLEKGRGD